MAAKKLQLHISFNVFYICYWTNSTILDLQFIKKVVVSVLYGWEDKRKKASPKKVNQLLQKVFGAWFLKLMFPSITPEIRLNLLIFCWFFVIEMEHWLKIG